MGRLRDKISFRPIIYVTHKMVRVEKAYDGTWYIYAGNRLIIKLRQIDSNKDWQTRGERASLAIYDDTVEDFGLTECEIMAYDGVIEHTDYVDVDKEESE